VEIPVKVGRLVQQSHEVESLIKLFKVDEPQRVEVRIHHLFVSPGKPSQLYDESCGQKPREINMSAVNMIALWAIIIDNKDVRLSELVNDFFKIFLLGSSLHLDKRLAFLVIVVLDLRKDLV
jgi:hypothetical protein